LELLNATDEAAQWFTMCTMQSLAICMDRKQAVSALCFLSTDKMRKSCSVNSGVFRSFLEASNDQQVNKEQYVTAADVDLEPRMGKNVENVIDVVFELSHRARVWLGSLIGGDLRTCRSIFADEE
jgi:hypothetical protein